ncbi:esterase/lipase family protein [Streptomyces cyaneochromogenes]|uniref:esterase/lipase family protein n=1 Tax=Streptomyces cyaneochromogenes TaxID=2496836 RepID=UPI00158937A0|nr:hypothetical protein [Streptomyces cyaneochromogenes]
MKNAVYFVHGINAKHLEVNNAKQDCKKVFGKAMSDLRAKGWKGKFVTWGYYKKDVNCTRKVNGNLDTRIQELGRLLAWDIYKNYSRHGKKVDVVGHSMGGQVIRAAITGVNKYGSSSKWPDYLYVEDVVTLASPFKGAGIARLCSLQSHKQCSDLKPGSGFLSWAGQNPQSRMKTDWTLIGSSDDDTVHSGSAIGMKAKHKVVYYSGQGLEHNGIQKAGGNKVYKYKYSDNNGARWSTNSERRAPLRYTYEALRHPSVW